MRGASDKCPLVLGDHVPAWWVPSMGARARREPPAPYHSAVVRLVDGPLFDPACATRPVPAHRSSWYPADSSMTVRAQTDRLAMCRVEGDRYVPFPLGLGMMPTH